MTPLRISMPGRNVASGNSAACTSMPILRTKSASRRVSGFAKISSGFRERRLHFGERPVDPLREQFDVVRLHGGAAPDAQARGRVAVVREIVAGAFLLDQRDQPFDEG